MGRLLIPEEEFGVTDDTGDLVVDDALLCFGVVFFVFFVEEEAGQCFLIGGEEFYDVESDCFVFGGFEGRVGGVEGELEHGEGEGAMFFAEGEEELNILFDIGDDLGDVEESLGCEGGEVELLVEGGGRPSGMRVPTSGTSYIGMVYKNVI